MNSRLVPTSNALRRIVFVASLVSLLPAWTCSAIVQFNNCTTLVQPQITAISPLSIAADASSVLVIVDGTGFVSQSEILWNGHPLQTTFVDSRHLQATITQQTFASFGGSAGSSVFISVTTLSSGSFRDCQGSLTSAEITLAID